jgi:hypothetical protein
MHRTKDCERLVKRGRRTLGAIYKLASGTEVYMAWRKTKDIYRGGEKCLSNAVADGKASWSIDDETVRGRQMEGIRFIGVWNIETDDKFIAPIESFCDRTICKVTSFEGRGGVLHRYLPFEYFRVSLGSTRVK